MLCKGYPHLPTDHMWSAKRLGDKLPGSMAAVLQVAVPKLQERKIAAARRKRQRIAAAAALSHLAPPSPTTSMDSMDSASGPPPFRQHD